MTCQPPFMPRAMLPPCRHCGEPSLDRVWLPHGCFVLPEPNTYQWLCPYHLDRLEGIEHTVVERLA